MNPSSSWIVNNDCYESVNSCWAGIIVEWNASVLPAQRRQNSLFNYLTGKSYVTVSNYPGTTVDIARGNAKFGGKVFDIIIDTPGIFLHLGARLL